MYKKEVTDFVVRENQMLSDMYSLLKLTPANGADLPPMSPGQFVQVKVPDCADVFIRRPISINFVDYEKKELWLLVRRAGKGTAVLCDIKAGHVLNLILPLGNGFSMPASVDSRILLVGGGVGVAPLLYFGKVLKETGYNRSSCLEQEQNKTCFRLIYSKQSARYTHRQRTGHMAKPV